MSNNERMNLLLNLIPIKKGGGQQVTMNFIMQISELEDVNMVYLVSQNSFIHRRLLEMKIKNIHCVKSHPIKRWLFHKLKLKKIINIHKIDLIYTLFGPGLIYNGIKSVTGCAYSNLFYPEIDFWKDYPFITKMRKKLIDKYRLNTTLKSYAIIFENQAMQQRCAKLFNFPISRTQLILPSLSEYSNKNGNGDIDIRVKMLDNDQFKVLMLTGWHKNKNIEIVPYVLAELRQKGITNISFVITVPPGCIESINLIQKATDLGVRNQIVLFDSVLPDEVPVLFESIQAVGLFSLLESFSNNIIEAWSFQKPLFIADEEWANAICKDAAVYVHRDDPKDIANKLMDYVNDEGQYNRLIDAAKNNLESYPSPKEKVKLQIDYLKKIFNEPIN